MNDIKLFDAAGDGDEALVSQLIEQGGYEVDWTLVGTTALHMAAKYGHPRVVTMLLHAGWSLEWRDRAGHKPLDYAAESGNRETVKTFLLQGAKIDTHTSNKQTSLYYASREGKSSSVKILLQSGADHQIRNSSGKTAEDEAKDEETRAVFREFNEKGLKTKNELFDRAVEEEEYKLDSH